MNNNPRFIKKVLYSLKRKFGKEIEFIFKISSTADARTGKITVIKDSFNIRRGILLPSQLEREFTYNLTFIASNKNFTYGGLYDTTERRVILSENDLPNQFTPEVGHSLIFEAKRWDVKKVQEFQIGKGYFLIVKQVTSTDLEQLIKRHAFNDFTLVQTVDVVIV